MYKKTYFNKTKFFTTKQNFTTNTHKFTTRKLILQQTKQNSTHKN